MSAELAILVIHGMGSQTPGFAEGMIRELNDRGSDRHKDPGTIAWASIYWADILERRELKYLRDAERTNDLDLIRLRRFMLTSFGDASAYQKVESEANTTYEEIHERIRRGINALFTEDLQNNAKPLIVMAHSLGGHIMSNYIWDMQDSQHPDLSPFEQMATLSGIVTFGCNIPFFTFAYRKVEPITFPPVDLPERLKDRAKWLNFYDPDDVLGCPLKPINSAYKKVVTADIPINVGGIVSSWNPLAHGKYWTDNDFTKPVAQFIASFL